MKKFLTVLLVVAVMFTFSFSSAMAFTVDETKALFAQAYGVAKAKAIDVDYDGTNHGVTNLDDPTIFTIDAATAQKGIEQEYSDVLAGVGGASIAADTVNYKTGKTTNIAGQPQNVALELLKNDIVANADADAAYKAAWDAYKAFLTGLVNKIDVSGYSEKTDNVTVALDGVAYGSAAKNAAADIAQAKDIINAEAYATVASYSGLYNKVFGPIIAVTSVTGGDIIYPGEVSSVEYSLVNAYVTKAQEAGDAATLEAQKASRKAELMSNVVAFKNDATLYNAAHADAVDAFVKAKTFLIDNAANAALLAAIDLTFTATAPLKNAKDNYVVANDNRDYIDLMSMVAATEKLAASMKTEVNADGSKKYDNEEIDDNLVAESISLLNTGAYTDGTTVLKEALLGNPTAFQTPSQKAALKIAVPTDNEIPNIIRTGSGAPVTVFAGPKTFYDKEFEIAVAAINAYNDAIDAAETIGAVDKAIAKLQKELLPANLMDDAAVDATWTAVGATLEPNVSAYIGAKRAAAGEDIYVAWAANPTKYAAAPGTPMSELMTWAFEKGARTKAEVTALYAEACKVVDGYVTFATVKAEAAKVVEMINALPATVALADKAAVKAANKAYTALHADAQPFVTNKATLDKDITALEKLEAYAVATAINNLPSLSKVGVADKEAVKAAEAAYNEYRADCAIGAFYGPGGINYTSTTYNFAGALANIQTAEKEAIVDAVKALDTKKKLGQLTAEDKKAVQAAQALIDAYNAEYADTTIAPQERLLAAVAKDVNELAAEGEIKAVESVNLKVRSVRGKGYIKITWRFAKGSAEDVQAYEVYRSTKKNSGFKKMFTTKDGSKMSYKNTKNLKKGKTYYYKVRAIRVVQDVKYTSDWSNKAYRVAK